ncbi:MAG: YggT family protein [Sphaerochaetaceae bacterium]
MYVSQSPTALMYLAKFLATMISIYSFLIWIRVIFTWVRIPGQMMENPLLTFLKKIVDPYLNWFSPLTGLKRSNFDLTPLAALAVLSIFQSILRMYGSYGRLTIGMVLAMIVQTLWGYLVSPLFWFIMIILVIRLIFCYRRSPNTMHYIRMLDSIDGSLLNFVGRTFFAGKTVNDRTIVWTSTIFYFVAYLICKYLVGLLISFLVRL